MEGVGQRAAVMVARVGVYRIHPNGMAVSSGSETPGGEH